MRKYKSNQQKGIGIIEVIVSLAVIAIAFWFFYGLAIYGLIIQEQNKAKIEALNLTSEAIEAVRSIRNEDWLNLSSLTPEVRYYPVISGNKWILSDTEPELINESYNRWIIIENVYRDTNDDISESGIADDQTKKITALTEWTHRSKTNQINLVTYLTNYRSLAE